MISLMESYRHICSFCDKQGKSLPHPEPKCNNKSRSRDKQPIIKSRPVCVKVIMV